VAAAREAFLCFDSGVARPTKSQDGEPEKLAAFRLREYRSADLPRLSDIDQQCFPPGIAYDRRELGGYIRRAGALTFVAEGAPTGPGRDQPGSSPILGFIVAQKLKRGIGHIITIDVLPQARRSGVGSRLMAEAEQRLHADGCHAVVLEVAVNNAAAIQFYKRHGYFVLKTLPRYYQGELDALLMAKRFPENS
jgi:ribosomal-protein-alanine N-acetyltransferase